jgi:hypothetical protein
MFSNPTPVDFGQDTFYFNGAAFSPNSRFIYAPAFNKLWQFDSWASDISASRILIGELNTPPDIQEKTRFNQARLAPDGKIYIAGTFPHRYLHVINRPNCYGLECGLQQYAIELEAPNAFTMPNMPHYKQWSEGDTCETVSIKTVIGDNKLTLHFYPNPTTGVVQWSGLPESEQVAVRVFDALGRLCLQQTTSETSIDANILPAGFYFCQIVTAGKIVYSGKFEKR